MRTWVILVWLTIFYPGPDLVAQRTYAPHSVLASGDWFRIAISESGMYKIDPAFLNALGINSTSLPVATIRVFGNGGQMLPEANSEAVTDDLTEISLQVIDDGDGIFNKSDYLIFYASGPDLWMKDSANRRFIYQKNLYEKYSYYFLTTGGSGRRIGQQENPSPSSVAVTSYDGRLHHELDTINFLSSGKQWYGEEFSTGQGRFTSRSFPLTLPGAVSSEQATIVSNCISRSLAGTSAFSVKAGEATILTHQVPRAGSSNLDAYALESQNAGDFAPSESVSLNYSYQPGGTGAQGWLNWFSVFFRATLRFNAAGSLFTFRDWRSVAPARTAGFLIRSSSAATKVWDLTNPQNPVQMAGNLSGTELRFSNDCSRLREYIAFNGTDYKRPQPAGKVANQDLHGAPVPDYIVITTSALSAQAGQIADLHRQHNNLRTLVTEISQVYNEFSSGSADPVSIRNFVKMFYDRAKANGSKPPSYLLLMGDASYDYKGSFKSLPDLVPAYESSSSLDPLSTYTSDDFYGFLDDSEDINKPLPNTLDIGIGRIPARNSTEAANYLAKIRAYNDTSSLGAWRNEFTFIADDEDFNLHLHDAEAISEAADTTNKLFHQNKIYLDAYRQESNSSGSRYPLVNEAIRNRVNNGTLIWNYSGHGGLRRLAEEVVLDADLLNTWENKHRLPLLITATCDFAPFDNPANFSLGENVLLRPSTGAIALMTTTRLVFAFSNRIINSNYLKVALVRGSDGNYPSLGEAVRIAKNLGYLNPAEVLNNLKFTLLGDPALTLTFPKYTVLTDEINGKIADTVGALQSCTIAGSVRDNNGQILSGFNGRVFTTVYDKIDSVQTLSNDPQSLPEKYPSRQRVLFKGETEVKSGRFSVQFIVPKDIDYKPGAGLVAYYATNGSTDANGSFQNLFISGSQGISADVTGPTIQGFLNTQSFVNGGTTGSNPVLLLNLKDSSGINITGSAIGHEIIAILDDKPATLMILNDYFRPVVNTNKEGWVRFQLPELSQGEHSLKIRAWDVANNSSEFIINFIVTQDFSILSVTNYPNPFRATTTFRFSHDLDDQQLIVKAEIFSVSGQHVKTVSGTINNTGNRSSQLEWDGKNDLGMPVFSGIYLYRLSIVSKNGIVKTKIGKMTRL